MRNDELDDACNRLHGEASRKQNLDVRVANAYHDGYVQGCEDMLKQAQHIIQIKEKEDSVNE